MNLERDRVLPESKGNRKGKKINEQVEDDSIGRDRRGEAKDVWLLGLRMFSRISNGVMGSVVFGRKRPNGRRIKGKVKKATKVLNKNLQTITAPQAPGSNSGYFQTTVTTTTATTTTTTTSTTAATLSLIISQSGSLKGMWGLEKDSGMIDQALGVVFPHLSAPPG
ncbi:hypothetical protein PABG_12055 [Paracoccidioides brasiliensis Pb03]|nr:hypothetical protein PABG_12055 [Paracoccidioides brasiliensis Pb03]